MNINGVVHCLFEQSGTFKRAFQSLGYVAYDYDICDDFHETDVKVDLLKQINLAYKGSSSVFDSFHSDDLLLAFYPCTYFSQANSLLFSFNHPNYEKLSDRKRLDCILDRSNKRNYYYRTLLKLVGICLERKLRLIIENPWSFPSFLHSNFLFAPSLIDYNRRIRGDTFKKPTAFWFINCERTYGRSYSSSPAGKSIDVLNGFERSRISYKYALNFICDFITGSVLPHSEPSLFSSSDFDEPNTRVI